MRSFGLGGPVGAAGQKRLLINQSWPVETRGLRLRAAHAALSNIGGGWRAERAWSLMVRLSDEDHYRRLGSFGVHCARIEPLLQAVSADGRVLAAPVVLLDHYHNTFAGGRWVMLNFEGEPGFGGSEEAVRLFAACERIAGRGAIQLEARPDLATVAPGERQSLIVHAHAWQGFADATLTLRATDPAGAAVLEQTIDLPLGGAPQHATVLLPAPLYPGLYHVSARLRAAGATLAQRTTGYWCRDEALLRGGPRLQARGDYLRRGDQPMPIVGTTYMASDVHRQFLMQPNPAIWDQAFATMAHAGVNFVRTGLWTGYEQVMKEPGVVAEGPMRAFEAFLHSARRQGVAVQFCFFAFQPDAFGQGNPYLDPEIRARQREFVAAFVRRFKDVPDLSWDLINEPSQFDPAHLFQQRPNYDRHERLAWNRWLQRRYSSYPQLLSAWNATPQDAGPWGDLRLPRLEELTFRQRWQGEKPLIASDWHLFAQEAFAEWARDLRDTIRACGSAQLVTVGQDEGAVSGRPSPWFHGDMLDHTCVHTWWLNDALLWDQLCATLPGKPLLVQETGIMQYEQPDEYSRRDEANRARLLERKFALALGAGAGFVQWLWNTNTDMNDDNEVAIGALRADGSEKPELACTRLLAPFAAALAAHAADAQPAPVVVVQPQALLYSVLQPLAIEATQNAVRALAYELRVPCRVVGENGLHDVGQAALIVLPYPRAFSDSGWQALLDAVRRGATLLIGGPLGDAHCRPTDRLERLGLGGRPVPFTARHCTQASASGPLPLVYSGEAANIVDRWVFDGDDRTLADASLGRGRIIQTAYPVELNDESASLVGLYRDVIGGLEAERSAALAPFTATAGSGVLVWPRLFPDATLYTCVSERAEPAAVEVTDHRSGATFRTILAPERAAMVLLEGASGAPIAAFVHEELSLGAEQLWPGGDACLLWVDGQMQARQLR